MKNEKMTADNVDQLLEIVKAVQRGEDPALALEKKRAESARPADSPKPHPQEDGKSRKKDPNRQKNGPADASEEEKQAESTAKEQKQAKKIAKRSKRASNEAEKEAKKEKQTEDAGPLSEFDDFDDEEFERFLNEDEETHRESKREVAGFSGALRKAGSLIRGAFRLEDDDLGSDPEEELRAALDEPESESAKEKAKLDQEASKTEKREGVPDVSEKPEGEKKHLFRKRMNGGSHAEQDAQQDDVHTGNFEAADSDSGAEVSEVPDGGAGKEDPTEEQALSAGQKHGNEKKSGKKKRKHPTFAIAQEYLQDWRDSLAQKGIHSKELVMIGLGIVLAVLVLLMIVNAVHASVIERKKKEHVTADSGLVVTVEKEPDEWCGSYPVELRFRAEGTVVTKVTINGTDYQPDVQGCITLETSEYLLEAEAATEKGTMHARIEIPKLDAAPPVVYVQREKDQITVTAADARSSVHKIWYAVVADRDYLRIPLYREYISSVPFEADAHYYFYAEDAAGNRSIPISTTMEQAEEIVLEESSISLYPDESRYLSIQESPRDGLLNNLRIESTNPEIVSIDNNGLMKALQEGTATIRVSADGIETVSCSVTVSKSRSVTVSAVGDCTLGTDEAFNTTTSLPAYEAMNGKSWFFRNVKSILENDDVTFANFEGTLTTETAREQKEYAFKGDPSYTDILKDGSIEVVTLANNHSSDYGEKSLSDTKLYLDEAEIDYCIGDTYVLREINGIKTAFIGIYVLNDGMAREQQVRDTIAAAKADGAQLVITAFHWGSERATQPDETQQALAHIAVDCGANLVVGHHPHVLQGIEKYQGAYIVYSLGNFCFGGNSAPSDTDTMIFRQTFTVSSGEVLDDDEIEIVPCSITSAAGYNNYQPTPAEGAEADRIMNRINEYSSAYGQTYTASGGLD